MKFSLVAVASLALAGMASAGPTSIISSLSPTALCNQVVTAVEATTCQAFAQVQQIAPEQLALLNGVADLDACKINIGDKVCVSAPKTKAKRCLAEKKRQAANNAAPAPAPAPAAAAAPPAAAPDASGSSTGAPSSGALTKDQISGLKLVNKIDPDCKLFYTIKDGDSCESVATSNGITQETLFSLNKNLHNKEPNTCDNLDTGKTYCVGK